MKETRVFNDYSQNINFAHLKSDQCVVDIHLHDSYEIFMALSPNMRYHIEGRAYDMDAYDVVITNEKEIHRPSMTGTGPYERRFVQFKPVVFHNFFTESYNPLNMFKKRELGKNNKIALADVKHYHINAIFDEIEQLFKTKSAKNMVVAKSLILRLISELEEIYQKNMSLKDEGLIIDERVENILAELNENFDKPFSLDELSRRHFMDKYYLCHLFKDVTGFSLLEYVQSKRIQQAKMLITQGTGIMEAARMSGFDEYSNFYKTFSKLVKMPPKKYKDLIISES